MYSAAGISPYAAAAMQGHDSISLLSFATWELVKAMGQRLRELALLPWGSQYTGSHNLGPSHFDHPCTVFQVFFHTDTCTRFTLIRQVGNTQKTY